MRAVFWVGLALLTQLLGCKDFDTCKDPGKVEACSCPGGVFGARTCLPEQIWGDCDCSAEVPLSDGGGGMMSGGVGGMTGGAGGMMTGGVGGMMTGGAGGMMTGGAGGMMTGGAGGMAGGDASMDMDASDPDSGGGGVGGSDPEPPAYGACTTATVATDCRTGSTCVESDAPLLGGMALHACAPPCSMAMDCPAAEGGGSAMKACVAGHCQLDCTAPFFGTSPSCPTGMSCTSKGAMSYCYDDGM